MWLRKKAEVIPPPPTDYSSIYISANILERAFLAPAGTILLGASQSTGRIGETSLAYSIIESSVVGPPRYYEDEVIIQLLTRCKCFCYANSKKHPALLIPPPIEVQYVCAGNEKLLRQVEDFIIAEFPDALSFPYLWKPE